MFAALPPPPLLHATSAPADHTPYADLEQDDDDTHEFSKTLAFDYISQADTTFGEIDEALYVPVFLLVPRLL